MGKAPRPQTSGQRQCRNGDRSATSEILPIVCKENFHIVRKGKPRARQHATYPRSEDYERTNGPIASGRMLRARSRGRGTAGFQMLFS